jgi:hypothetical protein
MTEDPRHPSHDDADRIPAALGDDLRALYGASDEIPSRVDRSVMDAARRRFAEIDAGKSRRDGFFVIVRRIGLVGGPLAAAAILALVVWITPVRPGQPQGPLPVPGMGRQQAQRMIEERVEEKMVGDRLDFERSERDERLAFGADADDAIGGRGAAESLATMAEAAPEAELADARRADRSPAPAAPMAKSRPAMREDFDHDGVVDIRDALAMAVVLEQGPWSMGGEWDLNNDGVIDADDVEVVSLAAVDLERRGEVVR